MEEDIKILGEYENIDLTSLLRTFKREGIENFIVVRRENLENLIKGYRELEENYINPSKARISYYDTKKGTEVAIEGFVAISKIKEKILNPMKEEHDKAIIGFMKRDIPQCIEDGGIAQVLGCFIGKIEELLEDK